MSEFEIEDGAGSQLLISADGGLFIVTTIDENGAAVMSLSLEQAREMAGWMRQAMGEMKGAAHDV